MSWYDDDLLGEYGIFTIEDMKRKSPKKSPIERTKRIISRIEDNSINENTILNLNDLAFRFIIEIIPKFRETKKWGLTQRYSFSNQFRLFLNSKENLLYIKTYLVSNDLSFEEKEFSSLIKNKIIEILKFDKFLELIIFRLYQSQWGISHIHSIYNVEKESIVRIGGLIKEVLITNASSIDLLKFQVKRMEQSERKPYRGELDLLPQNTIKLNKKIVLKSLNKNYQPISQMQLILGISNENQFIKLIEFIGELIHEKQVEYLKIRGTDFFRLRKDHLERIISIQENFNVNLNQRCFNNGREELFCDDRKNIFI